MTPTPHIPPAVLRQYLPALLIACTALLAAGTLVVRGNSCGHDFDFHLLSWMEVARAWHTGLAYPHWVQDANYGAGEPRLIFYPPASWLLGWPAGNHHRLACRPGAVRAAGAAGRRGQHVPAGAGVGATGRGNLRRLSLHRQSLRHVRGLRTLGAGRVAGRRMASLDGAVRA